MATSSRKLPGLGITGGWGNGENGYGEGMNMNWLTLSTLTQGSVLDIVTALPDAPLQGDIYLMDSTVTTYGNQVAVYDNGAWTYLAPQTGWTLFVDSKKANYQFDGTEWSAPASKVRFSVAAVSTPLASEVLGMFVADTPITFPIGLKGSVGKAGVAPSASYTMTVVLNGASVGSIAIDTTGKFTFTATDAIVMAAGDMLAVTGSATADSTLANMAITLVGEES